MGSSGGGSSKSPNDVNPAGQTTGYGSSTPFNPSYNSVLSNGMGWADTGEIDAANAANAQAVSTAQPAASTDGGYSEDSLRALLAQLMGKSQLTSQQQAQQATLARRAAMPGGTQWQNSGGGGR